MDFCGLAGPDPVGRLMSQQHVADASDEAVCVADHREPLQYEGGTGAIPQQLFEWLTLDTQLETNERDPDACIDREPAVLPNKHIGGGSGVEESLHAEPPHDTTAYLLGE